MSCLLKVGAAGYAGDHESWCPWSITIGSGLNWGATTALRTGSGKAVGFAGASPAKMWQKKVGVIFLFSSQAFKFSLRLTSASVGGERCSRGAFGREPMYTCNSWFNYYCNGSFISNRLKYSNLYRVKIELSEQHTKLATYFGMMKSLLEPENNKYQTWIIGLYSVFHRFRQAKLA